MMRLAILGAGSIARAMAKTVREMMANGEDIRLYAVASRSMEKAEAFARKEQVEKAYGSYEAMVADPEVDLVYVATPHSHHAEHMKLCILAGKAVLCEKAFTANAKQAEEILALAEEKHVLVTEAIWPRYMPSCKMIQDIVDSGRLGEIRMVTGNLGYTIMQVERLAKPELAGGALLDVGVYALTFNDIVMRADPVQVMSNVLKNEHGVDHTNSIVCQYENGVVSILMSTGLVRTSRRGCVYGTKGYLVIDNVNNPGRLDIYDADHDSLPREVIPVPQQLTGYEYQVRACMKALEDGAIECPEMPHHDTIRIMKQMDALRAQWQMKYPFED